MIFVEADDGPPTAPRIVNYDNTPPRAYPAGGRRHVPQRPRDPRKVRFWKPLLIPHIPALFPRRRAELAKNGTQVQLAWCPSDDSLAVTVLDDAGDFFERIVEADEALEVFNHPYAYAAFRRCLGSTHLAA